MGDRSRTQKADQQPEAEAEPVAVGFAEESAVDHGGQQQGDPKGKTQQKQQTLLSA